MRSLVLILTAALVAALLLDPAQARDKTPPTVEVGHDNTVTYLETGAARGGPLAVGRDDPDLEPGFPVYASHTAGSYHAGQAVHTLFMNVDADPQLEIVVTGLATGPVYAWNHDGTPLTGWPVTGTGAGYPAGGYFLPDSARAVAVGYWGGRIALYDSAGAVQAGWPRTAAVYVATPPSVGYVDSLRGVIFIEEEDWQLHAYEAGGQVRPGWPVSGIGGQERHTCAIADIDRDGQVDIVTCSGATTPGVYLFAYEKDGTVVPGFPVNVDSLGSGTSDAFPVVYQMDRDAPLEIIVANAHNEIRIYGADGALERTIAYAGTVFYSTAVALGDLDGDYVPEIVVQANEQLSVFRADGTAFPGWPVSLGSGFWQGNSSPVIGDVDGDGDQDIVITVQQAGSYENGELLAYDPSGTMLPDFPKALPLGAGSVPAIADIDADGRYEIVVAGSYWDGTPGSYPKCWAYDLQGTSYAPPEWPQFMRDSEHSGTMPLPAPMAGTYLVGASQPEPFNTLTNAAKALHNAGIAGNVILSLVDTLYTVPRESYPVLIKDYIGLSASYTVTIKPGAAHVTVSGASATALLKLQKTQYVVIDGSRDGSGSRDLAFSNTSTTTNTAAIWLSSAGAGLGCADNIIKNCDLRCGADQTSSTNETFGILACGSSIGTASSGVSNDRNTFQNNTIQKTRWGIYLVGGTSDSNDGNVLSKNVIGPSSFGSDLIGRGGIALKYQNQASVDQNEVRYVGLRVGDSAAGADRIGIGLGGDSWVPSGVAVTNTIVARNHVHDVCDEKTYSAVGIVVAGSGSPSGNTIANNMIHDIRANGTSGRHAVGIGIAHGNGDKVAYNSVCLAGDMDPGSSTTATGSAVGIRIASTTPTNLTLKNNIALTDATSNTITLKHLAVVAPSSYSWGTGGANTNDYYGKAGNPQAVMGGIGTTVPYAEITTVPQWRTQFSPFQDPGSFSFEPPFVSASDLHLLTTLMTPLEGRGTPVTGVGDDYDGEARSGATPDIGADEGVFTPMPAALAGTYPVGYAQAFPFNTLTNAMNTLNLVGIAGDVTLNLVDVGYSTYEIFPVTVDTYPGAGPLYRVTVKPGSAGVTISGASVTSILRLCGADYVVVDGSSDGSTSRDLTIANTGTGSSSAAVWVSSLGAGAGSTDNVVKNCNLKCGVDQGGSTTATYGVISCGTSIGTASTGADNDRNVFRNNYVTKCRIGLYLLGVSGNPNDNCEATENLIGSAAFDSDRIGRCGIIVRYQNAALISRNEVRFVGIRIGEGAGAEDQIGIGIGAEAWPVTSTTVTNSVVARNLVHDVVDEKTSSAIGILVAGSGSPSGNAIANNMIYNVRANGTSDNQALGIGVADGNGDKVVYNSISLAGDLDPSGATTATQSAVGVRISSTTPTNLTLKNNIVATDVSSNTSSLKHHAVVAPSTSYSWGTGGANNNAYYGKAGNAQAVMGGIGTSVPYAEVPSIQQWRTQFTPYQEAGSFSYEPPFLSASDLHVQTSVPTPLESRGAVIAGVTDDYDGQPRSETTPDMGADEGTFTSLSPLAGTYSVGAGEPAPFNILTSAVNTLNLAGISGSVTFNLVDAAYSSYETFPITIDAYPGADPQYRVTVKPAQPGVTISGSGVGSILRLCDARYVVVDGSSDGSEARDLTVSNTNTASDRAAFWISSLGTGLGASDNVVKNCNLSCGSDQTSSTNTTYGVISSGAAISGPSNGADNDRNTVQNNAITKVRWGIYLLGVSGNPNDSCLVADNLIGSTSFDSNRLGRGGIVLRYQNAATVSDNEVRYVGVIYGETAGGDDRLGIGLGADAWPVTSSTATSCVVMRNLIHHVVEEKTNSAVGILVAGSGAPSGNIVANNMIHNVRANGTSANQCLGIGIADGNGDRIAYNSIYLTGDLDPSSSTAATQSAVGIRIASTTPSNLTLEDNITAVDVNSNTSSLKHFTIVAPATSYSWGTGGSNNNDYHPKEGNAQAVLGGIGTSVPYTAVATLQTWRTSFTPNQDGASIRCNPQFVSTSDLHVVTSIPTGIEASGVVIAGIGDDYDGDLRDVATPDIGADEGEFMLLPRQDAAAIALVNPTAGSWDKVAGTPFVPQASFQNAGFNELSGVPVRYRIVGPAPSVSEVYSDSTAVTLPAWADPQTVSFSSATITEGGYYTMYVTAELAGDENPANDQITGTFYVRAPLAGELLVGSTQQPPFDKLTNAVSLLNAIGIAGNVTFTLTDLTYTTPSETFPIAINQYPGSSPSRSVTIRPAIAGVMITGSSSTAILKLNGADYVTIDGSIGEGTRELTISNTSTSAATAAIWLCSLGAGAGCVGDTVRDCNIACGADQTSSTNETFGIIASGSSISTSSDGADNDSGNIVNNYISKCRWGIHLRGVSGNLNEAWTLVSNTIGPAAFDTNRIGCGGIVVQYQNAATITHNEVRYVGVRYNEASGADRMGIGLGGSSWVPTGTTVTNSTVARNHVHHVIDERTYSAVGIIVAGTGTPSNNLIANNMIHNVRANGTSGRQAVGIGIATGNGDRTVFNSVYLSGDIDPSGSTTATGSAVGIRIASTTPSNLVLTDNITEIDVSSNTSSLKHFAIVAPSTSYAWGTGWCNYNDYYPKTGNSQCVLGGIGTTVPYTQVATLAQWQTQFTPNQDGASIASDPLFVGTSDLHISNSGSAAPSPVANIGAPITGVLDDYDGEAGDRTTTPDIGADEFTTYLLAVNVIGPGSVTKNPDYPSYRPGTEVELTALPDPGYDFLGWSGDASGSDNPLMVTMDRDKAIAASFWTASGGLRISNATVTEGDSASVEAQFVVTVYALGEDARQDTVRVRFETRDSTATVAGGDYQAISGMLVFAPADSADTVLVTVNGDSLDEPDEFFTVRLFDAENAPLADSVGVGTIIDNDPLPTLLIGDTYVTEAMGDTVVASFNVSMDRPSGRLVTVLYETADSTAKADSDYVPISPPALLTFEVGDTLSKAVEVLVLRDLIPEETEIFLVLLSNAVNAVLGDSVGMCSIIESPDTTSVGAGGEPVLATFLDGARPNPCAGVAEISLGLKTGCGVKLEIFDVQGRLVRTLADGPLPAGRMRMMWDGRDNRGRLVGSGVYYVRLSSEQRTFARRIVMIR